MKIPRPTTLHWLVSKCQLVTWPLKYCMSPISDMPHFHSLTSSSPKIHFMMVIHNMVLGKWKISWSIKFEKHCLHKVQQFPSPLSFGALGMWIAQHFSHSSELRALPLNVPRTAVLQIAVSVLSQSRRPGHDSTGTYHFIPKLAHLYKSPFNEGQNRKWPLWTALSILKKLLPN